MKWDWFSAASGAVVGAIGRWLLELGGAWFKSLTEEKRTIRAEERERANKEADRKREQDEKEAERKRAEAETVKRDSAILLALKTRLKGCDNWLAARGESNSILSIHNFFAQRPQYLEINSNREFLIKWPTNSPVGGFPDDLKDGLDELKRDADTLRVQ